MIKFKTFLEYDNIYSFVKSINREYRKETQEISVFIQIIE